MNKFTYIANVSLEKIEADSFETLKNKILISITDVGYSAKIKNDSEWAAIYRFQFEDVEEEEIYSIYKKEDILPDWAQIISEIQAEEIAKILSFSMGKNNIIVHCSAGVSRSGAITEAGLLLGFKLYEFSNLRTINKTVYNKIIKNFSLKNKILGKIKNIFIKH